MNLQKLLYGICFVCLATILPVSLTAQAVTSANSVEMSQQESGASLHADRDDDSDEDRDDHDGDEERDDHDDDHDRDEERDDHDRDHD